MPATAAAAAPAPRFIRHLISPLLDPIFAVAVGTAMAAVRIRREEVTEGGMTDAQLWQTLLRRTGLSKGEPAQK